MLVLSLAVCIVQIGPWFPAIGLFVSLPSSGEDAPAENDDTTEEVVVQLAMGVRPGLRTEDSASRGGPRRTQAHRMTTMFSGKREQWNAVASERATHNGCGAPLRC